GRVGFAAVDGRAAVADDEGVVVGVPPSRVEGELVVHDAKTLGVSAAEDTLLAAYLIEPGRASYELSDLGPEYGIELVPAPPAEEETEALVRAAEVPPRAGTRPLAPRDERDLTSLYRQIELP